MANDTPQRHQRLIPLGPLGPQHTPNAAIIHAFHRGPDGYIPLAAKRDGEWTELGAAPVAQPLVPELLTHLALDGYFALNSSFGTSKCRQAGTRKSWKPLPPVHPEYGYALDWGKGAEYQVEVPRNHHHHPITGLPFQRHHSCGFRPIVNADSGRR